MLPPHPPYQKIYSCTNLLFFILTDLATSQLVYITDPLNRGGIIIVRRQHKPYYWTVQWCRKVKQSGCLITGWSSVFSQLSQLSHLSYEDRVAEVRSCELFYITIGCLCCLLPTIMHPCIEPINFKSSKQGLLYHRTCKPEFLCSWPSLNSYLQ